MGVVCVAGCVYAIRCFIIFFFCILSLWLLNFTGPYSANGVPLRRVNQRYVIATSTKVALTGVDVSKIDDAFFAREAKSTTKEVLPTEKTATTVSAARKAAQTTVDAALTKNITDPLLTAYLKAKFSLKNNDRPHAMKF